MAIDVSDIAARINGAPWDTMYPQLLDYADFTLRQGLGSGAEADKRGRPCIEGRDAEWFLSTAIEKTLDGTRRWDPASVDLCRHLREAMRSLIDSHLKSGVVRRRKDSSETDVGIVAPVEAHADHSPSPAERVANDETSAERKKHVLAFKAALATDAELLELFEAYDAGYVTPRDIAAVTSLSEERISELKRKFLAKYQKFTKAYTGPLQTADLVRRRK